MNKQISSKDNRIFKECQKLAQKKYRDQEGKYLIEGPNLISEALEHQGDILYVILREGTSMVATALETYVMSQGLFDKLAQTETSQGMLGVVKKPETTLEDLAKIDQHHGNYIVMDRLQDPGNIGTIIRTAEGAGYAAVVVVKGTADVYSPKVIRAAAGSVFRIPIVQVEDNRELLQLVTQMKKRMVVTCLDTDKHYFDEDLTKDIALVIGNEGNGISKELLECAEIKVKIPMNGKLESLNASVAAGILMYEAMR
ncbi:TrmH family RNA methyltransferase [Clostridiales Family XIII bacterium PM5-7]